MLIFDQLKKDDPPLRVMALLVLGGLGVLLVGLWWVQIVSAREYQANLETQSLRTVRIPAVRGKILERNGKVLAENRPTYNVSLYLEEMRKPFDAAYAQTVVRARTALKKRQDELERQLHRPLNKQERKQFLLSVNDKYQLRQDARCQVASNAMVRVGQLLGQTITPDLTNFERHYETRLALPYPVLRNLDPVSVTRFEEQSFSTPGVDLEIQSTRVYQYHTTAAHLLGCLKRDDDSAEGEEAFFSYRLPDYRGVLGIEAGFDKQLRGTAGAKSVLVNNLGYRQNENIWSPAEPGKNVVLTIDLRIQQAAEQALYTVYGPTTRGAAVVMDVQTGDVLAMASCPALDPNYYIQGFPPAEHQRMFDNKLRPLVNRATQENYAPGSIFKTIVGMAALEAGLNPRQKFHIESNPADPAHGIYYVGRHPFRDTAPAGEHDFRSALKRSSNSYFIMNGLHTGIENIVRLSQRLHLGEKTGLPTRQEVPGILPSLKKVTARSWTDGETANMCIGQGQLAVTPIQMAVLTAAIANGGKVLWPRLVDRIEPEDAAPGTPVLVYPRGQVRDELGVRPHTLEVLREAMLADVEDSDGTGVRAAVPGLRICGKTGTAQVQNEGGKTIDHTTWFVSFAPYERPRYAVVIMIESGGSGGGTCAPVAHKIYLALQECERLGAGKQATLASNDSEGRRGSQP